MLRPCPHCKNTFDISDKPKGWMANHSRWCEHNPKRKEYKNGSRKAIEAMNLKKKETGVTNQFTKAKFENKEIPSHSKKGISTEGRPHTAETKAIIREKALASNHRRLRKKPVWYNGIRLDSNWELELAKRLDFLEIKWTRPDPVKWVDGNNTEHHYFPDFYLPDYDLYLDPKNPQAVKSQQEKLKYLLTQHRNVVILRTLAECKNFNPTMERK